MRRCNKEVSMKTRPNKKDELRIEALARCLELIQSGGSLEVALQAFGAMAAELRPLLVTAQQNYTYAASLAAPRQAQLSSRAKFLNAAQALADKSPRGGWLGMAFSRLAVTAVLFLCAILLGGLSTVAVSAQSLPGDLLYPVKIASEQTRLFLVRNPGERLQLEKSFDDRRSEEIVELLKRERSEMVS